MKRGDNRLGKLMICEENGSWCVEVTETTPKGDEVIFRLKDRYLRHLFGTYEQAHQIAGSYLR